MNEVDKAKVQAFETIFIGIVAQNMGYGNVSKMVNSGKAVFKRVGELTHREFRMIKKYLKENEH